MYSLTASRDFIAQHFLFGGDWGDENKLHSHHYRVDVKLEGPKLDQHGYLLDIVEVEKILDRLVLYFKDRLLNDVSEFLGLNPSIEHFAYIFCHKFLENFSSENIVYITIIIWENEIANASFRKKIT